MCHLKSSHIHLNSNYHQVQLLILMTTFLYVSEMSSAFYKLKMWRICGATFIVRKDIQVQYQTGKPLFREILPFLIENSTSFNRLIDKSFQLYFMLFH